MSNFDYLKREWKQIHEAAEKEEASAIPDPRIVGPQTTDREGLSPRGSHLMISRT